MKKINELFESVAGLESIKNELLLIHSWFKNRSKYEKMNIDIPKGILAYGAPGTGKTYVMREYSKLFGLPVIEVNCSSESSASIIDEAFNKAHEVKEAIVFIDEIDLLIGRNMNIARALQTNMDGFRERGNVIVLATANRLEWIPDPLYRKGRFDRLIKFDCPNKTDIQSIVKFYVNKMNVKSNIDYDYVSEYLLGASTVEIVAIVNDACLRSGCEEINTGNIEKSYDTLVMETYNEMDVHDSKVKDIVAIHEASHCVMLNKYNFNIYRASILKNREIGGCVRISSEDFKSMSDVINHVDVSIAGYIGTKLILGEADRGCKADLRMAIETVKNLVSDHGYKGIKNILSPYVIDERKDSGYTCYRNEKIVRRILKKRTRIVTRYLRANKDKVLKVASSLKEKGVLNRNDLMQMFGNK